MSQIKLDENAVAPPAPGANKSIIYPKADGLWYSKDDAGVETALGGGGGSGITELTGPITAGPGSGSVAALITDGAVTYGKIQNIATARLLGRATAAAGVVEEIVLGTNLSFTGTTLNAAGGGGSSSPTEQTTANTGAQNNFDLNARFTYLRCTGVAPEFSGFTVLGAAPQAGDTVIIDCLGTTVKVTTQGVGSTDVNRIICPSVNGQILGLNGRMLLVYDGVTLRWRESLVSPGQPIDVPFNASDFIGDASMVWTVEAGDVETFNYRQWGTSIELVLQLKTTTLSGTPSTGLIVILPAGFAISFAQTAQLLLMDGTAWITGWWLATASSSQILMQKLPTATFTLVTNLIYVRLQALVGIE